ncbi:MAG TPA: FAD-binding protein, partial [Clostridia bacterium]|nr:FAD-binding protein [Clostridia bacterium]
MNRYTYRGNISDLQSEEYDVIVIGNGIAGLYTALNIDENLSCLIISKDKSDTCNSWYAQGGVAAVILSEDDIKLHINDTLAAGAGL